MGSRAGGSRRSGHDLRVAEFSIDNNYVLRLAMGGESPSRSVLCPVEWLRFGGPAGLVVGISRQTCITAQLSFRKSTSR